MINAYLKRIGYGNEAIEVNENTLLVLHEKHLFSIPFEDLDIHFNKEISLDLTSIFNKVILSNRGGFCYELNYLFYNLLIDLGFTASIISARIHIDNSTLGPEFDHMSIIVNLNGYWLLDVGFGDSFIKPLKIEDGIIQKDSFKYYRIDKIGVDTFLLSESIDGIEFIKKYQFSTESRNMEDFKPQCHFKQYSPDSNFVKKLICTLPTSVGRTSIVNRKFIETVQGNKQETEILDEEQFFALLKDNFNVEVKSEISNFNYRRAFNA